MSAQKTPIDVAERNKAPPYVPSTIKPVKWYPTRSRGQLHRKFRNNYSAPRNLVSQRLVLVFRSQYAPTGLSKPERGPYYPDAKLTEWS